MARLSIEVMLEAGVHFGHLTRKWHPAMAPYILMKRNGIHIIDLNKTAAKLEEAAEAIKRIAASGKTILFVGTKKQAKEVIESRVKKIKMPYVTERWPGGMLTNFTTIRRTIKKISQIDELLNDPTAVLNKKERLQLMRKKQKLEKDFGSIADMNATPGAIFIVDIKKEHIAVEEARRLGIPTFAIVDTNSDPRLVDYPIPANDDASRSVALILDVICQAVVDGLKERQAKKEASSSPEAPVAEEAASSTETEKSASE
jgi:small subunit ribosomal protein S2